jgi:hypothetical protein
MFLLGKTEKKAKNLKHIERKRNKSNAMNIEVLTKKKCVLVYLMILFSIMLQIPYKKNI